MAIIQSDFAKGNKPTPYPSQAGVVVAQRFYMTVPANAALNDILELGILPAGCRPVDATLDADDLDTNGSPLIALDVGIMSGKVGSTDGGRTCGSELLAASQIARTGGSARLATAAAFRITATDEERSIGVKIQAAAATGAAGVIGLTLYYVAGSA